ncbi:hypothetical protein EOE18_07655 [Novosphingobium umbonatum]|uniref:Tetracyclin repressor-like C-terminal group 31 domain-containing protein n=1 Tax=Novosphingobium umbonatum TaxID=1908524 RepID=A0A3S2V7U4_9SPHN|nr:hypothetical protein [Novosphingobium umbonatum]RVU05843.1 hypothetical protein EOE18_07655 [Novosphingobium umbonatum]
MDALPEAAPREQTGPTKGNRRDELARGALEVLGLYGSRGFTHRALDRHLGLPEGTTSAYYRRREDLVAMAIRHVFLQDARQLDDIVSRIESLCGGKATRDVVAQCCLDLWHYVAAQSQGTLVLARYECFIMARRDPELMALVENVMLARQTRWEPIMAQMGAKDPAAAARYIGLVLRSVFFSEIFFPSALRTSQAEIDFGFFSRLVETAIAEGD